VAGLPLGASNNLQNPPVVRFTPNVYGFPDRLLTQLRYSDVMNITGTAGAVGFQNFRWNSTFDPDITNTGHQPLYRDVYAAIYDSYAVIRSRARITIENTSTTYSVVCGAVIDDDSSPTTNFNILMEQNHGVRHLLTPLAGSKSSVTFDMTWDCKQILGIDPYTSQAYKTASTSNPTEASTLSIWMINQDGTNTVTVQGIIELVQEVLWTELSTPSIS
jgi:hypothetical protein